MLILIVSQLAEGFKPYLQKIGVNAKFLTPQSAESAIAVLFEIFNEACAKAFRQFIESYQPTGNAIVVNGQKFRFNKMEPKEFATPFGKIIINRRVYYRKKNKAIYVPLDHMWGMSGECATVEIREKIGYLTGLINPQAIADIFARFTPCPLSVSFIQKTGNNIGQIMEEQNQQIVEQAHKQETALPKGTKTIAVGLDGARAIAKLPKSKQEQKHSKRNFFAANAWQMNYAQYRQQGLPISSGPVETGCKTIVKARLCCSGMRWTRTRAQHVLRIRTMIKKTAEMSPGINANTPHPRRKKAPRIEITPIISIRGKFWKGNLNNPGL